MADVSDLSYAQLAWTTEWYIREDTLKAAMTALVNYQHHLPLEAKQQLVVHRSPTAETTNLPATPTPSIVCSQPASIG